MRSIQACEREAMWAAIAALPIPDPPARQAAKDTPVGRRYRRSINHHAFAEFDSTAAYWAGMIMSDGNVNDRGDLVLQLQTADRDHVFAFRDFLRSDHTIMFLPPTTKYGLNMSGAYRYAFRSHQIVADLSRIGITPRKSLTAFVGGRLDSNRHFWRGILDGDGNIGITRNGTARVRLACGPYLVAQFHDFIRRILPSAAPFVEQRGTILRLDISGRMAALLCDALYTGGNEYLARKHAVSRSIVEKYAN